MTRIHQLSALAVCLVLACSGGNRPEATLPAAPAGGSAEPTAAPAPAAARPKAIETPKLYPQPLANDPAKVTIHRLSNGMTVYLSPDRQQPTIVAHIAVRAGSRNDPRNSTGLAHYLEHMLFKGTSQLGTLDYAKERPHLDKIAALYAELRQPGADRDRVLKAIDSETQAAAAFAVPNELEQVYSRIGITGLNAFTNSDVTAYITDIPKNRVAQWAHVEAARYSDPVFRLFWPELEAVYEEKNRSLDNPAWRVREALLRGLFPDHGYGWSSTIGEIDHLKSPAYADMVAFFNRYYTPQNMAVLLAGDVDESVLPLLDKELGELRRPAGDAMDDGAIAPLTRRTEVAVQVPSDEGVLLGWQLMSATHADRLALEVADLLLLDGAQGILSRDLLLTQKVADAGCNPTFLREAGFYELYADALAGQTHAQLEAMLLALVGKLQRGEFTDTELATAILTYELNQQRQLESNAGRTVLMEQAFIVGEDWRSVVERVERMRRITRADIMRVTKQYLGDNRIVIKKVKGVAAPPKITKPGITPVQIDPTRQSAYAKAVLAMPAAAIEPVAVKDGTDYRRGTLPTGPLITVENKRNGLFTAVHQYDFGRAGDRLACFALDVLKVSGAGSSTPEQVARKLHELGLSVDTACGRYESSISLSGIDRNLDAGMALLREWLARPAFDDAILKAAVASELTQRANTVANPQAIAGAQASYARFGADSDQLVVPSNKQLEAATPAQLKKLLAGFLRLRHRTSYFGPRDHAAATAAVALGDGKQATTARKPIRFRPPRIALATDQETAQTHVSLIWPRKPANDNERAVGALFAEYIYPVLYGEVREARGLAYTVYGGYATGARRGDDASLFAYVGTQSDKSHDALDAVLAALRLPLEDSRLGQARETIAQNHRVDRIEPRELPFAVYAWEDQGEPADPRAARTQRTLAVTRPDLEQWIKAALAGPLILSVTGDRKKLDEAKLSKLAPVTFVPVTKLFGY